MPAPRGLLSSIVTVSILLHCLEIVIFKLSAALVSITKAELWLGSTKASRPISSLDLKRRPLIILEKTPDFLQDGWSSLQLLDALEVEGAGVASSWEDS